MRPQDLLESQTSPKISASIVLDAIETMLTKLKMSVSDWEYETSDDGYGFTVHTYSKSDVEIGIDVAIDSKRSTYETLFPDGPEGEGIRTGFSTKRLVSLLDELGISRTIWPRELEGSANVKLASRYTRVRDQYSDWREIPVGTVYTNLDENGGIFNAWEITEHCSDELNFMERQVYAEGLDVITGQTSTHYFAVANWSEERWVPDDDWYILDENVTVKLSSDDVVLPWDEEKWQRVLKRRPSNPSKWRRNGVGGFGIDEREGDIVRHILGDPGSTGLRMWEVCDYRSPVYALPREEIPDKLRELGIPEEIWPDELTEIDPRIKLSEDSLEVTLSAAKALMASIRGRSTETPVWHRLGWSYRVLHYSVDNREGALAHTDFVVVNVISTSGDKNVNLDGNDLTLTLDEIVHVLTELEVPEDLWWEGIPRHQEIKLAETDLQVGDIVRVREEVGGETFDEYVPKGTEYNYAQILAKGPCKVLINDGGAIRVQSVEFPKCLLWINEDWLYLDTQVKLSGDAILPEVGSQWRILRNEKFNASVGDVLTILANDRGICYRVERTFLECSCPYGQWSERLSDRVMELVEDGVKLATEGVFEVGDVVKFRDDISVPDRVKFLGSIGIREGTGGAEFATSTIRVIETLTNDRWFSTEGGWKLPNDDRYFVKVEDRVKLASDWTDDQRDCLHAIAQNFRGSVKDGYITTVSLESALAFTFVLDTMIDNESREETARFIREYCDDHNIDPRLLANGGSDEVFRYLDELLDTTPEIKLAEERNPRTFAGLEIGDRVRCVGHEAIWEVVGRNDVTEKIYVSCIKGGTGYYRQGEQRAFKSNTVFGKDWEILSRKSDIGKTVKIAKSESVPLPSGKTWGDLNVGDVLEYTSDATYVKYEILEQCGETTRVRASGYDDSTSVEKRFLSERLVKRVDGEGEYSLTPVKIKLAAGLLSYDDMYQSILDPDNPPPYHDWRISSHDSSRDARYLEYRRAGAKFALRIQSPRCGFDGVWGVRFWNALEQTDFFPRSPEELVEMLTDLGIPEDLWLNDLREITTTIKLSQSDVPDDGWVFNTPGTLTWGDLNIGDMVESNEDHSIVWERTGGPSDVVVMRWRGSGPSPVFSKETGERIEIALHKPTNKLHFSHIRRVPEKIKLAEDLQVQCAWCRALCNKSTGTWEDSDTQLTRVSHGLCPKCEKIVLAELESSTKTSEDLSGLKWRDLRVGDEITDETGRVFYRVITPEEWYSLPKTNLLTTLEDGEIPLQYMVGKGERARVPIDVLDEDVEHLVRRHEIDIKLAAGGDTPELVVGSKWVDASGVPVEVLEIHEDRVVLRFLPSTGSAVGSYSRTLVDHWIWSGYLTLSTEDLKLASPRRVIAEYPTVGQIPIGTRVRGDKRVYEVTKRVAGYTYFVDIDDAEGKTRLPNSTPSGTIWVFDDDSDIQVKLAEDYTKLCDLYPHPSDIPEGVVYGVVESGVLVSAWRVISQIPRDKILTEQRVVWKSEPSEDFDIVAVDWDWLTEDEGKTAPHFVLVEDAVGDIKLSEYESTSLGDLVDRGDLAPGDEVEIWWPSRVSPITYRVLDYEGYKSYVIRNLGHMNSVSDGYIYLLNDEGIATYIERWYNGLDLVTDPDQELKSNEIRVIQNRVKLASPELRTTRELGWEKFGDIVEGSIWYGDDGEKWVVTHEPGGVTFRHESSPNDYATYEPNTTLWNSWQDDKWELPEDQTIKLSSSKLEIINAALFDFMGYLTTRDEKLEVGSHEECSPILDLYQTWAKERGIDPEDHEISDAVCRLIPIWQDEVAKSASDGITTTETRWETYADIPEGAVYVSPGGMRLVIEHRDGEVLFLRDSETLISYDPTSVLPVDGLEGRWFLPKEIKLSSEDEYVSVNSLPIGTEIENIKLAARPVEVDCWCRLDRLEINDKFKFSDKGRSHVYQVSRDVEVIEGRSRVHYTNLNNGGESSANGDRFVLVVELSAQVKIKLASTPTGMHRHLFRLVITPEGETPDLQFEVAQAMAYGGASLDQAQRVQKFYDKNKHFFRGLYARHAAHAFWNQIKDAVIGEQKTHEGGRTAFQPSTTGHLHIGNIRTCLYAYCYAKSHGLAFDLDFHDIHTMLSIEKQREFAKQMVEDLTWLGFEFDHTYQLSERTDLLDKIWSVAKLSYPVCTEPEYLPSKHYIESDWLVQDLMKSDLTERRDEVAALAYANLNDVATGITTQVLGRDVASMTTHFTAWSYLLMGTEWQWPVPGLVFVELITDPEGKKISKSNPDHEVYSIMRLRELGVTPERLLLTLYNSGMEPQYRLESGTFEDMAREFDITHLMHYSIGFDIQSFIDGTEMQYKHASVDDPRLVVGSRWSWGSVRREGSRVFHITSVDLDDDGEIPYEYEYPDGYPGVGARSGSRPPEEILENATYVGPPEEEKIGLSADSSELTIGSRWHWRDNMGWDSRYFTIVSRDENNFFRIRYDGDPESKTVRLDISYLLNYAEIDDVVKLSARAPEQLEGKQPSESWRTRSLETLPVGTQIRWVTYSGTVRPDGEIFTKTEKHWVGEDDTYRNPAKSFLIVESTEYPVQSLTSGDTDAELWPHVMDWFEIVDQPVKLAAGFSDQTWGELGIGDVVECDEITWTVITEDDWLQHPSSGTARVGKLPGDNVFLSWVSRSGEFGRSSIQSSELLLAKYTVTQSREIKLAAS